jgi:hypothetical protein
MGLQPPGGLVRLLQDLGFTWPEADEQKLLELGGTWLKVTGPVSRHGQEVHGHAQRVWSENTGEGVDAFQSSWQGRRAPVANLQTASSGCAMIAAGVMGASAIVLALKINVIAQLTMLAIEIFEALATAPETLGASLLEIPVFKEITQRIVNAAINEAINVLLEG